MKRLRSNFNEANLNIKNDVIDIMSKDDALKETLYGYTLGKNNLKEKEKS